MKYTIIACVAVLITGCIAQQGSWYADELAAALEAAPRPEADRARDAGRKPAGVMAFAGIARGMTVLDVMTAGGYYAEALSVAVGPNGRVYAQNPDWLLDARNEFVRRVIDERFATSNLPNAVRVDGDIAGGIIAPASVDAALMVLVLHDTYYMLNPAAALAQLGEVHTVLKPGGVLVIVDHHGNPDQPNDKLHRIPRELAIQVASDAGFTLEAESDLLANPDDPRTQMVFGMRGETDRFMLRFRK